MCKISIFFIRQFFHYCGTYEDAAEQKARTTYDNILRLVDDPDIKDPIKFLRAREVAHFQRFGEALREVQDNLDSKNFYGLNIFVLLRKLTRLLSHKNECHFSIV